MRRIKNAPHPCHGPLVSTLLFLDKHWSMVTFFGKVRKWMGCIKPVILKSHAEFTLL